MVVITSPAGAFLKYCNEHVCGSMCLSVCEDISRTIHAIFTNFLCMLPMAMAQSSYGIVVICYVLPFLWMSLCFFSIMGHIAV